MGPEQNTCLYHVQVIAQVGQSTLFVHSKGKQQTVGRSILIHECLRSKPAEDQFQPEPEPLQTRSFHPKKHRRHNIATLIIKLHIILVLGKEGRRGYILKHPAQAIPINLAILNQNLAKLPPLALDLDPLPLGLQLILYQATSLSIGIKAKIIKLILN